MLIEDGEDAGLSLRGLFLISPTGILRQMTVNDLPVGRSVDETLRLLQVFQDTDEHGEVCPDELERRSRSGGARRAANEWRWRWRWRCASLL